MDALSGFSIPITGTSWDHAYVTSRSGKKWECFGRDVGGSEICSAIGDSQFANCLSDPKYATWPIVIPFVSIYAGITYMKTGVCHQAANRILRATGDPGIEVATARVYGLSLFAYGTYGKDPVPWPQLVKCATTQAPQV
jgi:hypothetical protein